MQGAVCVVTGGSGIVGGGVVCRLLTDGATVIAPVRSEASRSRLEAALAGCPAECLHTPLADWGSEDGARQLASFVRDKAGGAIDHVVSIGAGAMPPGVVTAVATSALLHDTVDVKLLGHMLLAKELLPLMKQQPSSSWTVVNGMLGEICPWPETALVCIGNAAVGGMVRALQAQLKDSALRVNELRISAAIRRDSESVNPLVPHMHAYPATKLGAVVAGVAAGRRRDEIIRVGTEDLEKVQ